MNFKNVIINKYLLLIICGKGDCNLNTIQLTCFLAVAETLNFARAAEQLHITQPAVTHQIRSLESELNTKLFRRTTRTVELTHAGFMFLNDARSMLEIAGRAVARFSDPSFQEVLRFSVGCPSYAQLFSFPDIFRNLRELYPQLYPNFQVAPFQHLLKMLEEESLDVVIGFHETDVKKNSALFRELKQIPLFCVCTEDSPLAAFSHVTAADFGHERLVLHAPFQAPPGVMTYQRSLASKRLPSELYFCESPETVLVLVAAGFGASVLPELFIPPDVTLVKIPIADAKPLSMGIYYKTLQGNPVLRDFIRLAREI